MIFYFLLRLIDGINFATFNPFAQYEYGIGVSIAVECVLLFVCIWVSKIICYRIDNKTTAMRWLLSVVCYCITYPIVWCCFWMPNTAIAAGLSILGVSALIGLILCLIDIFTKERRN